MSDGEQRAPEYNGTCVVNTHDKYVRMATMIEHSCYRITAVVS